MYLACRTQKSGPFNTLEIKNSTWQYCTFLKIDYFDLAAAAANLCINGFCTHNSKFGRLALMVKLY